MNNQAKRKGSLWVLLGLIWSSDLLGETILDLDEKETDLQAEFLATEIPVISQTSDEREAQSTIIRNGETQHLLFMRSENIPDHLLSSGGTPFTQFEAFTGVNFQLNNDQKLKEASEKQKKELLDRLIKKYLQSFSQQEYDTFLKVNR